MDDGDEHKMMVLNTLSKYWHILIATIGAICWMTTLALNTGKNQTDIQTLTGRMNEFDKTVQELRITSDSHHLDLSTRLTRIETLLEEMRKR